MRIGITLLWFLIAIAPLKSQGLSGCPTGVIFLTPDNACSALYQISGLTGIGAIEWRTFGASLEGWTDIAELEAGYDFLYGVTNINIRDQNTSCFFTIVVTELDQYPPSLPNDTTLIVGQGCLGYYEFIPYLPSGCKVINPLINSFTGGLSMNGGRNEWFELKYYNRGSSSFQEHTWRVNVQESCADCTCEIVSKIPISINTTGASPALNSALDISSSNQGMLLDIVQEEYTNFLSLYEMAYSDKFHCLQILDQDINSSRQFSNCSYHIVAGEVIPAGHSKILASDLKGQSKWISATDIFSEFEMAKDTFHNALFHATSSLDSFQVISANQKIRFQNGLTDSEYTAPRKGYYLISTDISFEGGDGTDDTMHLRINRNGIETHLFTFIDPQYFTRVNIPQSSSLNGILLLEKGDVVEVYLANVGSTIIANQRTFSGHIISE